MHCSDYIYSVTCDSIVTLSYNVQFINPTIKTYPFLCIILTATTMIIFIMWLVHLDCDMMFSVGFSISPTIFLAFTMPYKQRIQWPSDQTKGILLSCGISRYCPDG